MNAIEQLGVLISDSVTVWSPELRAAWEAADAEYKAREKALCEIHMMACYASEEDTGAREAVLLKIGEKVRATLPEMSASSN